MGSTLTLMALSIKVRGKMICRMGMGMKFGRMGLSMMAITRKGRNMALGCMSGSMLRSMMATGLKIELKGLGFILGLMADAMKDIGVIITCMGKEFTHGKTDENMTVTIKWIRNMVSVSTIGLMVVDMKACGLMVNSMAQASTLHQINAFAQASGKTGKGSDGSMRMQRQQQCRTGLFRQSLSQPTNDCSIN